MLTICKYLISRTENPKALKIISEIISSSKLEIDNVKLELLEKCMDEKEYKQMFDDIQPFLPRMVRAAKIGFRLQCFGYFGVLVCKIILRFHI